MGHVGQEKSFRFTGFFRGGQSHLKLFILPDPVKRTADEQKHDEHKNAPAKQDTSHDQIRLPKQSDNQISNEKQDQQQNGKIKEPLFLVPVPVFPNISGETYITVYVVSHQSAAGIYHQIEDNVFHNTTCFKP